MSTRDVASTFFSDGLLTGSVTASAGAIVVLREEPHRNLVLLYNDSTSAMYLKFCDGVRGVVASNDFSFKIAAAGYWEMPKPPHTGALAGHWDTATGSLYFTQLSS